MFSIEVLEVFPNVDVRLALFLSAVWRQHKQNWLYRKHPCTNHWEHTYRITAVLKVEIDIIASIAPSPKGQAVIVVIMYVETFKTDVIVFIDNVLGYLTSNWPKIFSMRINSLILTISWDQRKKVKATDKLITTNYK